MDAWLSSDTVGDVRETMELIGDSHQVELVFELLGNAKGYRAIAFPMKNEGGGRGASNEWVVARQHGSSQTDDGQDGDGGVVVASVEGGDGPGGGACQDDLMGVDAIFIGVGDDKVDGLVRVFDSRGESVAHPAIVPGVDPRVEAIVDGKADVAILGIFWTEGFGAGPKDAFVATTEATAVDPDDGSASWYGVSLGLVDVHGTATILDIFGDGRCLEDWR